MSGVVTGSCTSDNGARYYWTSASGAAYAVPPAPTSSCTVFLQNNDTANALSITNAGAQTINGQTGGVSIAPCASVTAGCPVKALSYDLTNSVWIFGNPTTGNVAFATSTTSNTIGTGSQTFTITPSCANTNFTAGQFVQVIYQTTTTDYEVGTVTSCTSAGSSLVVSVTSTGGSGTFAAWNITGAGPPGPTGATGSAGTGNNAYCADATGSTTTYTCPSPSPGVSTLSGLIVSFVPQTTNTGTSTLNVNALGAITIYESDCATVVPSGGLVGGQMYYLAYNGSGFCEAVSTTAANVVTAASSAAAADQMCVASGTSKTCTYIDYPEVQWFPVGTTNNGTPASRWNIPSSNAPTLASRAGTNNVTAVLQWANNNASTHADFMFQLPNDWSGAEPYVNVYYGSGSNTTGTVVWTYNTACSQAGGGITDDPSFVTSTTPDLGHTMAASNREWSDTTQLSSVTSGNNCVAGSWVILRLYSGNGSATNTVNVEGIAVTLQRRLVVQAN